MSRQRNLSEIGGGEKKKKKKRQREYEQTEWDNFSQTNQEAGRNQRLPPVFSHLAFEIVS